MKQLYIINHSGGKDSQAMFLLLAQNIPMDQIIVIHAHLPEVEWQGTISHIQETIGQHDLRVVTAAKTFFEMVERRGKWPAAQMRQCTSDLKRDPINKEIRKICKERGIDQVVNCFGLRAEESSSRAKKETWRRVESKSTRKLSWFEWLPIHSWSTEQVFGFIRANGQEPHWAYSAGMSRLSCSFCIMSSKKDLQTAARLNPDLFAKYVAMEKQIDHTFIMPGKNGARKFLTEIIAE